MTSFKTKTYNFASAVTAFYAREGDNQPETFTKEQVDALIAEQTKGLKSKNEELLGKVHNLGETVKKFDGVNLDQIKNLQEKLDKDEDMRLIAEGKTLEVVNKHTERMRADFEAKLKAESEKVGEAHKRADKYKQAVLDNQIRASAKGLHPGAVEDALLHARNLFQLDDNGNAVQVQDGNVVLGKDGKTPFSPSEWFEQMKETKPHWFPSETAGSGSGNARQASGTGKTIKRSDFNALPPMKQADVARAGTTIVD